MKFSVPTNWQKEMVKGLVLKNKTGQITEVYGKLAFDDIGGGRPASALPFVSKKEAERHVSMLQVNGFKFNYLLNGLCMGNLEFSSKGQERIKRLLDWLIRIKIDSVTIASPFLAIFIEKNYPQLSIYASVMANIDSSVKAQFWQNIGVKKITFPGAVINRDFNLIKLMRNSLNCEMQLIANNACLCNCPTRINHELMGTHASQGWHKCRGYMFDYNMIFCRLARLRNPMNFIRADWIRPEDVNYYENLGVDSIKLVDRRLPTEMLLKIIEAYLNRRYAGNLVDLFHTFQGKTFNTHFNWKNKLLFIFNPFSMDPLKVLKFSKLLSKLEVFIDNQSLNGFLDNFPKECDLVSCDSCGYCKKISDQVVKIEAEYLKETINQYEKFLETISKNGLAFSF